MHCKADKAQKGIALLLSLVMAAVLAVSAAMPAQADDVDELRQQKEQLQQQLDAINQQIEDNQAGLADAEEQRDLLQQQRQVIQQQISVIQSQLSDVNNQINAKQAEVDAKQVEINEKQADIDQRWSDFKLRMKAMQRLNDGGSIALLSSATNLYELLSFQQTLEDIYSKDDQVLAELDAQYDELNTQKQELETQMADLEANLATLQDLGSQLDSKQNELQTNLTQTEAQISEAEALAENLTAEQQEIERQFNEAADALDAALRESLQQYDNAAQIHCSLNFINPLNSYKYISCQYGSGGHKGVDFAAPGGTPIRAIAAGQVITSTYHSSYGNYVMVYHGTDDQGNTYASLYAHMISTPAVGLGQAVAQGDVLGYVGSTGNSTGNHLHLELRVNGARTNALNYVPH